MHFSSLVLLWVTAVPVVAQSAGKAAVDRAAPVKGATKAKPVAEDWLVWGGKNRDFVANASGLADSWPAAGPKKLWSRALGDGYSAIAEENGVLYTAFRRESKDVVTALEAATSDSGGNDGWRSDERVALDEQVDANVGR